MEFGTASLFVSEESVAVLNCNSRVNFRPGLSRRFRPDRKSLSLRREPDIFHSVPTTTNLGAVIKTLIILSRFPRTVPHSITSSVWSDKLSPPVFTFSVPPRTQEDECAAAPEAVPDSVSLRQSGRFFQNERAKIILGFGRRISGKSGVSPGTAGIRNDGRKTSGRVPDVRRLSGPFPRTGVPEFGAAAPETNRTDASPAIFGGIAGDVRNSWRWWFATVPDYARRILYRQSSTRGARPETEGRVKSRKPFICPWLLAKIHLIDGDLQNRKGFSELSSAAMVASQSEK